MAATPNFVAGGDISASHLVVIGAADHTVIQATGVAAEFVGVAQEGSRRGPRSDDSADDRLAAKSGESLQVFGDGEECLLVMDTTCSAGDYLTSSGDGQGTPVLFTETGVVHYAGIALEACTVAGQKIRFLVRPGVYDTL
jgi:hypothetical protein